MFPIIATSSATPGPSFSAKDISVLNDLQRLPFLTKPIIRKNQEELKSEAERLARFNTGGSSGEPLIFFIGNEPVSHAAVAAKWRATRWWNVATLATRKSLFGAAPLNSPRKIVSDNFVIVC